MKKKNKDIIENLSKEKEIEISQLKSLDSKEQYQLVYENLNAMYEGKVDINKGMVNKILKLTMIKRDDYMILNHHLVAEKFAGKITLKYQKKISIMPVIILLFIAFTLFAATATYFGFIYLEQAKLNKDIDGDGVADINLDLDGDGVADINIDTDDDDKPDLNIDYKGNYQAVFNIDTNNDGVADFNLVNDATGENLNTCTLNCDTNGDGWPNQNYDVDGDGTADFDIYSTDLDMIYEKIDLDGDMVCDVMCDDDEDGVCDRNCIVNDGDIAGSGPSTETGNSGNTVVSGSLLINYKDSGEFNVDGIMPDDQYDEDDDYPSNTFTVTNNSEVTVYYKMTMIVTENTYTSENFMYSIESTNDGYNQEFTTAPWEDKILSSYILIEAGETQTYTITFKLNGIDEEQNYDQGQTFSGNIKIGD